MTGYGLPTTRNPRPVVAPGDTFGMLGGSLLRVLLVSVVVITAIALLALAALWLILVLLAAGGVLWLNLVIVPRLTRRLRVPRAALEVVVLLVLGAAGWLLGGTIGLALGGSGMAGRDRPAPAAWRLAALARTDRRLDGQLPPADDADLGTGLPALWAGRVRTS